MGRTNRNTYRGARIRRTTRLAIYLRDRFQCQYCGRDLHGAEPFEITLDHLNPNANGGTNDPRNLVTSCRRCNCRRKDRPWREYAPGGSIRRIENARRRKLPRDLARDILYGKHPETGNGRKEAA